jgi:hypothetical protein
MAKRDNFDVRCAEVGVEKLFIISPDLSLSNSTQIRLTPSTGFEWLHKHILIIFCSLFFEAKIFVFLVST